MRRVGKGFSGVETPLFETMLVVRDVAEDAEAHVPAQGDEFQEHAVEEVATDRVLDTCFALVLRVEGLENDKAAQQLEIVKLKARVKKLEKIHKVKSSKLRRLKKVGISQRVESSYDVENVFNQGRMIVDMDQDEGIELVVDQEKDAEVEGRHADKQAKIYNIDLDHSSKVVAASTPILAAKPKTLTITAAPAVSTRRRKGVKKDQIEMDAEYARNLQEEINKEHEGSYKNIDWNADLDHVQSKEPQYIKRYHGIKKKPQTESEARKNMISYLKNTKGYKMDFFKGKTYDEILPIFQAKFDANMKFLFKSREEMEAEDEDIIKSINETPAQKAVKRRKLSEEAKEADDLRKRLEIVQDEDDDVFVEATLLAQKVPVVDYQIVVIDNKPKYKIIRADDTHQFYISFTTLLKNFDKEDLETLRKITQVGDLSTHTTRFISPALTQKVFANTRRVGKGFSGVETPLFEGMLAVRQPAEEGLVDEQVQVDDAVKENVAADRVENLENDNAAQKLLIIKLKTRVKRLEKANIVKSSKLRRLRKVGASRLIESSDEIEDVFNQERMIDDMDKDKGIELVKDADIAESEGRHATEQEVVEVVTTAKLITEVVTTAASQVSAASATIPAAITTIPSAAPTVVAAYTRRRKGVIIRDPEEELSSKTLVENLKVKDKGKGILVETPKPMKKKDQIELDAEYARKLHEEINRDEYKGIKKRPQTRSEARKNMMIYLKNTSGYKMDFFKGMTYAQICPIFQARFDENMRFLFKSSEEMEEEDQKIIKSINKTPIQKAAKRRKLTTPLTRKVPVVDYQIVLIGNKPRYPLSRFTLEQLVNVTRLQVEEESEMSLEILRLKLKLFKNIAAAKEITK
nr:hypothetical protein [Tanacetum cinerariifolium]